MKKGFFEIASNSKDRKYNELTYMTCLTITICQSSLDIFSCVSPLSAVRFTSSLRSVWCDRFLTGFYNVVARSVQGFTPQMSLAAGTKWFQNNLHLILCIGFCELGFWLLCKMFTSPSILLSGLCILYHNFYLYFPVTFLHYSLFSGVHIAESIQLKKCLSWVSRRLSPRGTELWLWNGLLELNSF